MSAANRALRLVQGQRLRAFLGALGVSVVLSTVAAAGPAVETISTAQLAELLDRGVTVIDVRRADEWRSTGVVENSRLITAYDAEGRLSPQFAEAVTAVAAKDKPVVLICRSGNRSGRAAALLTEQLGYAHVYNVAGGMQSWLGQHRAVTPCSSC